MHGVYTRWRLGEPREQRTFGPMAADHPLAVEPCPVCDDPLGNGEPVQLLALGPDCDERERFHQGRWTNVRALTAHAACLGPLPEVVP